MTQCIEEEGGKNASNATTHAVVLVVTCIQQCAEHYNLHTLLQELIVIKSLIFTI